MTDAEIVAAVRSGTHTLVPMPFGRRKFFVGHYGDADVPADALVLILDLFQDAYEGEEMIGLMMGGLSGACDAAPTTSDRIDDAPF